MLFEALLAADSSPITKAGQGAAMERTMELTWRYDIWAGYGSGAGEGRAVEWIGMGL